MTMKKKSSPQPKKKPLLHKTAKSKEVEKSSGHITKAVLKKPVHAPQAPKPKTDDIAPVKTANIKKKVKAIQKEISAAKKPSPEVTTVIAPETVTPPVSAGTEEITDQNAEPVEEEEQVTPSALPAADESVPAESEKIEKKFIDTTSSGKEEARLKIEALLFASGKSLSEDLIAELCEIDKRTLKKSLEALQKDYDLRESALMIVRDANGWKITVREKYLSTVRKIVADTELARSVMETLSVIAWKTPIYQSELVRIRGNKCYDHVAELEDAGFIVKEKRGRSFVLKTTEKFYTYFDIDQKNLQGVMNEANVPAQTTLDQIEAPEEKKEEERKINWDEIQIHRKESHPEEEAIHREFLENIDHKITAVSERTEELAADLPSRQAAVPAETAPHEEENATNTDAEEQVAAAPETVPDTAEDLQSATAQAEQASAEESHKPKSLTKKQLEKKFKEDLVRVREKMEKVLHKKG